VISAMTFNFSATSSALNFPARGLRAWDREIHKTKRLDRQLSRSRVQTVAAARSYNHRPNRSPDLATAEQSFKSQSDFGLSPNFRS
jgi:hypothetical protein